MAMTREVEAAAHALREAIRVARLNRGDQQRLILGLFSVPWNGACPICRSCGVAAFAHNIDRFIEVNGGNPKCPYCETFDERACAAMLAL